MLQHSAEFTAIGTKWNLQASGLAASDWEPLLAKIRQRALTFDQAYSRFRQDSWLSGLSRQAGQYSLPEDGYQLLNFYKQLYEATGGRVTPLIGQTMADAGYDQDYSFKPKALKRPPAWDEVIQFDAHNIRLKQPAWLDFGAAGKGRLVDIICKLLDGAGASDYVVDASGDIAQRSANGSPINLGLENPLNTSQAVGIASLCNQSLCASAGSRRKWDKFTHIIDPFRLSSPEDILATWVIANDTMTADGLATALFFTDADSLARFDFDYAVLHQDMSLERSRGFPAKVFEALA